MGELVGGLGLCWMGCMNSEEDVAPEGGAAAVVPSFTKERPWLNEAEGKPVCNEKTRLEFADILKSGLVGAKLNQPEAQKPNVYLIFGFASQGYGEEAEGWPLVEAALEKWCKENDERHKEDGCGWILMSQGDGDYGKKSIESIAQYVAKREPSTPVIFVQSDYGCSTAPRR